MRRILFLAALLTGAVVALARLPAPASPVGMMPVAVPAGPCPGGCALDGSNYNIDSSSITLTTSKANDIVCWVGNVYDEGSRPVTSVSGGDLTWSQLVSGYNSSALDYAALWCAAAPVPLSSATITASGFAQGTETVFGISGSTQTYDGTPQAAASSGTASVSMTTAAAKNFLIGFAVQESFDDLSAPNDWTAIGGICNSGNYACPAYQIVSASGSQSAVFTNGGNAQFVALIAAVH